MNDVVERLEEDVGTIDATGKVSHIGTTRFNMTDAIAEIARLEMLVAHEHEFHQLAVDLENEVRAENAKLREFFEAVFEDAWDLCVADGGDLQDTAERLGLIVRVPADAQFRDEYGADEMFVWSWSSLALEGK